MQIIVLSTFLLGFTSTVLYYLLKLIRLAKRSEKKVSQIIDLLLPSSEPPPKSPCKVLPLPRRVANSKLVHIDVEYVRVRSIELGVWVDYQKLLSYLSKGASKLEVFFYSTTHPQVQAFNSSMKRMGHHVIEQPVLLDEERGEVSNTNIDPLMVDGLINESPASQFGKVIIISGDHKFVESARLLTHRNQHSEFVAFKSNTSTQIKKIAKSNELISYLPLESLPGVVTKLTRHQRQSG
ncbi:MAG: NYN domain-containing protein [Symploca sp. SIO1B1]|nr:NYN domain-containing protein [Symploca sp. SIO1B1]